MLYPAQFIIIMIMMMMIEPNHHDLRCGKSLRRFWKSCHPQSGLYFQIKGDNIIPETGTLENQKREIVEIFPK